MKTEVSIIVPCYNHGNYLEDSIGSIFANETTLTYQIIIVDDCSTDDTAKICESFKDISEISYIRNEVNYKLPKTRNIGIKQADSEYIVCLDADDCIPKNYIQENYNNLVAWEVDVSYSNSQCFGTSIKLFNWPIDPEVMKQYPFVHCSSMFRKSMWESLSGFDESFVHGYEDYDFWLRALKAGYKFKKCERTNLLYRQTYTNMSATMNKEKADKQIKEKHKNFYTGVIECCL